MVDSDHDGWVRRQVLGDMDKHLGARRVGSEVGDLLELGGDSAQKGDKRNENLHGDRCGCASAGREIDEIALSAA